MSIDPVTAFGDALNTVVIAIILVALYRALELRGTFVSSPYRSRAGWMALLLAVVMVSMLTNYLPNTPFYQNIGFLTFPAVLLVIFAFVDRSVIVAMQSDFFHRNTLYWSQLRWAAGVVMAGAIIALVALSLDPAMNAFGSGPPPPSLAIWVDVANFLFEVVIPGVIAYGTASLIVAARRTSERALKRNLMFLGLALATLVISLVASSPFSSGTLPYLVVNDGTAIVGMYLLYRAVMSLSPLGRVEKEVAMASQEPKAEMRLP
jgi:hypothetical protein